MRQQVTWNDLRITGNGTAGGGTYNRVKVLGDGIIEGDLTCRLLKVTGTVRVNGRLRAEEVRIVGTAEIDGPVEAHRMHVRGMLTVHGSLEVELCRIRGTFHVEELVNAEELDIRLYGPAQAREIGGSSLVIREGWRWFGGAHRSLAAGTVEGDDVVLERTRSKTVRGRQVHVDPGCNVDRVEYSVHAKVSRKAHVKEVHRV